MNKILALLLPSSQRYIIILLFELSTSFATIVSRVHVHIDQTFAYKLSWQIKLSYTHYHILHIIILVNELLLPVLFVVSNQSVKEPRHNAEPVLLLLIIMSINGNYIE